MEKGIVMRLGQLGLVLLLLTGLALGRESHAAARAGEVLLLRGDCKVESEGRSQTLKPGDPVHVGDKVAVAEGAKLKLRMIDGSVIAAGAGTQLTIQDYSVDAAGQRREAVLSLGAGLLRAVVSPTTAPSRFEVDTATGVAAVRSTDWFVEASPTNTQVGVLTGLVVLTGKASQRDVRIPARWGSRVAPGLAPVPARVWTQAEFDDVIRRTDLE